MSAFSQDDHDSFWNFFLSPFLKKHKPEEYDPDFKISLKRPRLLKLETKPFNPDTCLSGSIQEELREQNKKTEIDKKKKVAKLDSQLSDIVNVSQVESPAKYRILQHRTFGTSTPEKALISSQAACKELELTTEEASRQNESIIIIDDEEEVEDSIEEEDEAEEELLGEEQVANLKKVTGLARDREKLDKEKSHQRVSASSWTITTLELYIKRDKVHLVETLVSRDASSSSERFDSDHFFSLQNVLVKRSRQVLDDNQHFSLDKDKGLRLWSFQFTKPMLKEEVVTFMALEIIGTACDLCDVRMKPQETLQKIEEFPNARVDFALAHENVVFGVVEVKTPKTMTKNALAQLLVSLLRLQRVHNEERMQYLGILTDGFRFILVKLQGNEFVFESTKTMQREEVKIHSVVSWDHLRELCEFLRYVIASVTANLLKVAQNSLP